MYSDEMWLGQGWKGFQFVHLVRQTDLLYRDLWMNASAGTGGMWMPSFWVRSRFQATDTGAKALGGGLGVRARTLNRNHYSHCIHIPVAAGRKDDLGASWSLVIGHAPGPETCGLLQACSSQGSPSSSLWRLQRLHVLHSCLI